MIGCPGFCRFSALQFLAQNFISLEITNPEKEAKMSFSTNLLPP
jgi:hypothetical protein